MKPQKFRKKPVEIEAMHFVEHEDLEAIAAWCGGRIMREEDVGAGHLEPHPARWLDIPTLEGVMQGRRGDWIVRGVKGEFYPVKPDIFEATYEPVQEATP